MIFKPNKNTESLLSRNTLKIVVGYRIINRVNSVKYLGLYIDENLTWCDHVKKLTSKISSLIGIVFRKRQTIPNNCKKTYTLPWPIHI